MAEKTKSPKSSDNDTNKQIDKEEEEEELAVPKQPTGGFKDYFRIFQYADRLSWILYIISSISGIASGVTLPVMGIIFGNSISQFNGFSAGGASSDEFKSQILKYVLVFIYLFVAKLVLTYISMVCISIAGLRTTGALRKAFLEKTLRQEIWHFDSKGTGAVANQVTTNGTRVNQGIADQLAILIQATTMFFAAFIVALSVQWKLSLITMTIIPAIFLFVGGCIAADAPIESRIIRIYSRGGRLAEEVFSSIKTVHAFWAQTKMVHNYNEFLEQAHQEGKKKSILYGILFSTQYFFIYSGTALAYWQGYRMFASGEIENAGTVFTVVFSVSLAATAIGSIAPQFPQFTNAAGAASELFETIDKSSLLDPLDEGGEAPVDCKGDIEVRGLTFAYPLRPSVQVLKDFDISIPAGKTTALVGASGCGKSTLVGLLERWYERAAGSIELDGLDISHYNTHWLRSRIRLVQQEPVLFRGTVFENVANGLVDNQLTLPKEKQIELVHQACKASYAHEFILELPKGYDTEVGERAGMLSGGQRQRIAIARSIISNPRILLLDEATSALDPKSERIVQKALDEISVNRTTLIIAHKLATVKMADNIAVVSNGAIAEQGTHHQLMKMSGLYAKLVAVQDLGNENNKAYEDEKESRSPNLHRKPITLFKPESSGRAEEHQQQKTGSMGYSLIKCIIIMLGEQKSLYRVQVISLFFCLVAGATFPGQAVLFSRLLRAFTLPPESGQREANFYALMFFILALGNLVAYFVIGINCNIIGQEVTHRYRHEMFSNIIRQDISFFDLPENTSGALTSNVSALPTQLQDLISANILLIVIIFVNVVASSIVALAFGWKLGLVVVFGGFPPLLLSGYVRIRIETKLETMRSTLFADSASLASEVVVSMKTISSLTLESTIIQRYSDKVSAIVQTSIRSLLVTLIGYAFSQALLFLIMALGFWYGSQLLASGEYTITQFYVIFIGIIFAGQAAAEFFGYTTSISRATGAANYILWLRSLKPTMQEDSSNCNSEPNSKDDGNLALCSLNFNYPQRTSPVLKDLSMVIPAGQFAAFVGASGCGKSTMISLLERFYDPTTGQVQFAEKALTTYSPRLYRQNVSLVQQEPTLYSGSIRENVVLGIEGVEGRERNESEDRIIEACRQANALEFIQSLPEGLSTPCGSRGLQFSGGQKQRIAIARALIRKPRLLLLDEATSALDTQSERVVQAALDQAKEGRTTIAVAHRLSTIKHADIIFVFGNGRIEEYGTHEELLAKKGRYYEMCLVQSLDQAMY